MRRIDAIGIALGVFLAGGLAYWLLQGMGLESADAGIWSQVLLVGGLVGWLLTYLTRVVTHKMTYNQQLKDYTNAVLKQKLASMSPEEIEQLQAEVDRDHEA